MSYQWPSAARNLKGIAVKLTDFPVPTLSCHQHALRRHRQPDPSFNIHVEFFELSTVSYSFQYSRRLRALDYRVLTSHIAIFGPEFEVSIPSFKHICDAPICPSCRLSSRGTVRPISEATTCFSKSSDKHNDSRNLKGLSSCPNNKSIQPFGSETYNATSLAARRSSLPTPPIVHPLLTQDRMTHITILLIQ